MSPVTLFCKDNRQELHKLDSFDQNAHQKKLFAMEPWQKWIRDIFPAKETSTCLLSKCEWRECQTIKNNYIREMVWSNDESHDANESLESRSILDASQTILFPTTFKCFQLTTLLSSFSSFLLLNLSCCQQPFFFPFHHPLMRFRRLIIAIVPAEILANFRRILNQLTLFCSSACSSLERKTRRFPSQSFQWP